MSCSSESALCAFAGVVIIAAICTEGPTEVAAQAQLTAPPARTLGDVLTYNWAGEIGTWTYVGKNNGVDCFNIKTPTQQGTECHDAEDNMISRAGWRPAGLGINIHLSFPLYVGKDWEYTYVTKPANEGGFVGHRLNGNHTQKLKVTGVETIATSAGSFEAYKIQGIDQNWGSQDVDNLLLYYSPRLGYLKRRIWYYAGASGDSSLELVSYRTAH